MSLGIYFGCCCCGNIDDLCEPYCIASRRINFLLDRLHMNDWLNYVLRFIWNPFCVFSIFFWLCACVLAIVTSRNEFVKANIGKNCLIALWWVDWKMEICIMWRLLHRAEEVKINYIWEQELNYNITLQY